MKEATITPFAKPLYIMTKPVGAVCNLACDYCYYLEKSKLYEEQPRHVMSDELLEKFIKEIYSVANHAASFVYLAWGRKFDASFSFL